MKHIRSEDLPRVAAGHEDATNPGVWKQVLLQRADLQQGSLQMLNWASMPVGRSFAAHYHEDMQEVFIIVEGAARILVAGETAVLRRGDAVVIDAREVHQMWNDGDEELQYIAFGITANAGGKTVVVE